MELSDNLKQWRQKNGQVGAILKKLETRIFCINFCKFECGLNNQNQKVMDEARTRLEKAEAELDDLEESQVSTFLPFFFSFLAP